MLRQPSIVTARALLGLLILITICSKAANGQEISKLQDTQTPILSAVVKVSEDPSIALSEIKEWKEVPQFLEGAQIYDKPSLASPTVSFSVAQPGVILLAASWNYEGGGWDKTPAKERQLLTDLMHDAWIPIGTMTFGDNDEHIIFRRIVKAGEQFKIHTRSKVAPFVVVVPNDKVTAVMSAPALVPSDRRTLLTLPPETLTDTTGTTNLDVALLRAREPEKVRPQSLRGLLLREIVRQGLSLAAREQLGLPTRDTVLREGLPQQANAKNFPLEMLVNVQSNYDVETAIFYRHKDNWECLWDDALSFPETHLYERLVTAVEALSRTELVDALNKAGFQSKAALRVRDTSELPDGVDQWLEEVTIPAQFAALSALHLEIAKNGESPELLGALARSYATLGVLTEYLWSPAHKVFKARSLLYAERAVAQWPQSVLALENRAYARALVGLHASALEDLAAAEKLEAPPAKEVEDAKSTKKKNVKKAKKNAAEQSKAAAEMLVKTGPAWLPAIEAYCKFDDDSLAKVADQEAQLPLVRLLQLLAAESSGSEREVVQASKNLSDAAPVCLRAIDGLTGVQQLGIMRFMAQVGPVVAEKQLLLQISRIPNLPARAQKLIDDWKKSQTDVANTGTSRDEMQIRLQVINELRTTGQQENDSAEPSWEVLAQLLEDVDFVLAWRRVEEVAYWLGLSADESEARVDDVWPQVEHHPYAQFIASFRAEKDRSEQALRAQIESLDMANVEYIEQLMLRRLDEFDPAWHGQSSDLKIAFWREDYIASDLSRDCRQSTDPMVQITQLRIASPYMPFGIAQTIIHGRDQIQTSSAKLEKQYAKSAAVQGALATEYAQKKQWDDAVRCYRAALKLDPDQPTYLALAAVYEKQNDETNWLATLEEYLKSEDFGLGHAQVEVKIADHFIKQRDWQTARHYADDAAKTWAAWAMAKAAQCAEAMQDWDAAEMWYKNASQRYDSDATAFEWYEFCKRTGHGNVDDAKKFAFEAIKQHEKSGVDDWYDRGTVNELSGRHQEATESYEKAYKSDFDVTYGLYAAIAADRAADQKSTDRILQSVLAQKYDENNPITHAYLSVARSMDQARTKSEIAKVDFEKLEKLAEPLDSRQAPYYWDLLGEYADICGQADRATQYYRKCMSDPEFTNGGRTLAGARLVDRGILPESYKAVIWEKPSDTQSAAKENDQQPQADQQPQTGDK